MESLMAGKGRERLSRNLGSSVAMTASPRKRGCRSGAAFLVRAHGWASLRVRCFAKGALVLPARWHKHRNVQWAFLLGSWCLPRPMPSPEGCHTPWSSAEDSTRIADNGRMMEGQQSDVCDGADQVVQRNVGLFVTLIEPTIKPA